MDGFEDFETSIVGFLQLYFDKSQNKNEVNWFNLLVISLQSDECVWEIG